MYTEAELEKAHKHSRRNKEVIAQSESVGCFHCREVYPPAEIKEWIRKHAGKDQETALCGKCGIDSVIGSAAGIDLNPDFLKEMEERWFGYRPEAWT